MLDALEKWFLLGALGADALDVCAADLALVFDFLDLVAGVLQGKGVALLVGDVVDDGADLFGRVTVTDALLVEVCKSGIKRLRRMTMIAGRYGNLVGRGGGRVVESVAVWRGAGRRSLEVWRGAGR